MGVTYPGGVLRDQPGVTGVNTGTRHRNEKSSNPKKLRENFAPPLRGNQKERPDRDYPAFCPDYRSESSPSGWNQGRAPSLASSDDMFLTIRLPLPSGTRGMNASRPKPKHPEEGAARRREMREAKCRRAYQFVDGPEPQARLDKNLQSQTMPRARAELEPGEELESVHKIPQRGGAAAAPLGASLYLYPPPWAAPTALSLARCARSGRWRALRRRCIIIYILYI